MANVIDRYMHGTNMSGIKLPFAQFFDWDNPNNWDYVLVDKDLNEYYVGYDAISHKANHLRLPSDHLRCKNKF